MKDEYLDGDQRQTSWDRLVDGELSREEYRELITQLDDEPGGWRQCALAFLEAQAWGQELRERSCEASLPAMVRVRGSRQWSVVPLTVTVVLLLALVTGVHKQGWWPFNDTIAPHDVERGPPAQLRVAEQDHASVDSSSPVNSVGSFLYEKEEVGSLGATENMGQNWLARSPSAVPDRIVRVLHRMGHTVLRRQRYLPLSVEGGHQVVLPVEEIEVLPVSAEIYQ